MWLHNFLSFSFAEVILLPDTPLLIVVNNCIRGHPAYTVHMLVDSSEINPLLAASLTGRTVKIGVDTRTGLVKESNQVIFHVSFAFGIKTELPIHIFN